MDNLKEINLEGQKYLGKFKIEKKFCKRSVEVSSEVGMHLENQSYHYYEGEGFIKDKKTGLEQKFLIYPQGYEETDLIMLREATKEKIKNYQRIVDIALEKMYEKAKESEEIIPKIRPEYLDDLILSENLLIQS